MLIRAIIQGRLVTHREQAVLKPGLLYRDSFFRRHSSTQLVHVPLLLSFSRASRLFPHHFPDEIDPTTQTTNHNGSQGYRKQVLGHPPDLQ